MCSWVKNLYEWVLKVYNWKLNLIITKRIAISRSTFTGLQIKKPPVTYNATAGFYQTNQTKLIQILCESYKKPHFNAGSLSGEIGLL